MLYIRLFRKAPDWILLTSIVGHTLAFKSEHNGVYYTARRGHFSACLCRGGRSERTAVSCKNRGQWEVVWYDPSRGGVGCGRQKCPSFQEDARGSTWISVLRGGGLTGLLKPLISEPAPYGFFYQLCHQPGGLMCVGIPRPVFMTPCLHHLAAQVVHA